MKSNKIKIIALISFIIFLGLVIIGMISYSKAQKIIKDDIRNITKLTCMNIYSELEIGLIKPIVVSLTMANDQFLKDWIEADGEQDIDKVKDYLSAIKEKYDYDSAFFVSNISSNYYHYKGILKQISEDDAHDVWFYNFLEKDVEYVLDIDTDQAAKNSLTFFVNCRILGQHGDVLGVTGTGVELAKISRMLSEYNKDLGVEVVLVDNKGAVQIHADESYIQNYNIFDEKSIAAIRDDILEQKEQMQIFKIVVDGTEEYLVTRYIEELDWYLVVSKDTAVLHDMLTTQLISELIVFALVLTVIMLLNTKIISHFQSKVNKIASIDMLTKLENRRMFDEYLKQAIEAATKKAQPLTLVLIDIDDFKHINDTHGHVVGDAVIKAVANSTKSYVREDDVVARWGGDEFVIVFHCPVEKASAVVQRIQQAYKQNEFLAEHSITASFGMTAFEQGDTVESILERTDNALYSAKKKGKNTVHQI